MIGFLARVGCRAITMVRVASAGAHGAGDTAGYGSAMSGRRDRDGGHGRARREQRAGEEQQGSMAARASPSSMTRASHELSS
jgi:hypothetical protein